MSTDSKQHSVRQEAERVLAWIASDPKSTKRLVLAQRLALDALYLEEQVQTLEMQLTAAESGWQRAQELKEQLEDAEHHGDEVRQLAHRLQHECADSDTKIAGLLEQLEATDRVVKAARGVIAAMDYSIANGLVPSLAEATTERVRLEEFLRPALAALESNPAISPAVECDGTRYCVAKTHVHGCFAERIPGQAQSPAISPKVSEREVSRPDDASRGSMTSRSETSDPASESGPSLRERLEASRDVTRFGTALKRIADAVEAWDNDETPDEDFPFDADMDFVNFCGHVARAALTSSPASEPEAS